MRTEIIKKSKKITWIEIKLEDLIALILYLGIFCGLSLGLLITICLIIPKF